MYLIKLADATNWRNANKDKHPILETIEFVAVCGFMSAHIQFVFCFDCELLSDECIKPRST